MRRIWLCADDYGLSRSVNAGIRDLVSRGRLNATSIMVVPPSFDAAEAKALLEVAEGGCAIGLHLTLTGPLRPLTAAFAPLRDGAFLPLPQLIVRAVLRRLDAGKLRHEIDAQFEAFQAAFGAMPDYVDGHQHVHLLPQVRDVVLDAIRTHAPGAWVRQCGSNQPLRTQLARDRKAIVLDAFNRAFVAGAKARGLSFNPGFAGTYDFGLSTDFPALFTRFFDGLPDGGLVMCHPGFVDDELRRLDPQTEIRKREHAFLAGDAFGALLSTQRIGLLRPTEKAEAVPFHSAPRPLHAIRFHGEPEEKP